MLTEQLATEWEIMTWAEDEDFDKFTELAPRANAIVAGRIRGDWPATPKLRLYQIPSTGVNWIGPDDDPDCKLSRFPFAKLDNVIMTPHSSASTDAMRERRRVESALNLDRFARGNRLQNLCFKGTGSVVRNSNEVGHA